MFWLLSGDCKRLLCVFYILTEVSQFVLLTLFSRWFIPEHGALGAARLYGNPYYLLPSL